MAGLPVEDGQNILARAEQLLREGLGNGAHIADAVWLTGRGQPVQVKVECASAEVNFFFFAKHIN